MSRSDSRKRDVVISTRLGSDELQRLQALADERGQTISTTLREVALERARSEGHSSVQRWYAGDLQVSAQAQRTIDVWSPSGRGSLNVWSPDEARQLAAALLAAADVAEQRNPQDEAYDARAVA